MAEEIVFWENPLFVRFRRSRLRSQQTLPAILAVVVICGCLMWWSYVADVTKDGGGFTALLVVQGILLLLIGTNEVAMAVAQSRDSGMLDLHRISPQTSLATAVGFVLGGSVREWVLFACTLPFLLYASLAGKPGIDGFVVSLVAMASCALLYHSLAAMAGCLSKKPRSASNWAVGVVVILALVGIQTPLGLLTPVPSIAAAFDPQSHFVRDLYFFGGRLPPLVLSLIHQVPLALLLLVAAVRKMRSEYAMVYSKPTAVVFVGFIAFLALGHAFGHGLETAGPIARTAPLLGSLYSGLLAGLMLTVTVTPTAGQTANGVRRARKLGLPSVPVWSDLAVNWAPMWAFAVILALCGVFVLACFPAPQGPAPTRALLGVLVTMATLVTFACAHQYFLLRFPRGGQTYVALLLFLVWVMPAPVGSLMGLTLENTHLALAVMSVSAPVGVYTSVAGEGAGDFGPATLIAVACSLLTALLFLGLRIGAEQQVKEAALRQLPESRRQET